MKARLCLLLILLAMLTTLTARQEWPQALALVQNENMEYNGIGCALSDGSYLLSWKDNAYINASSKLMRYSSSNQELWSEAITFGSGSIKQLYPTADGGFLLLYTASGGYLLVRKYDALGQPLWNNQEYGLGVYISSFQAAIAEDSSGGIWMLCVGSYEDAVYHYFSPSGVPAVLGGTDLPSGQHTSCPNLVLCPSGGVVLSYAQNYHIMLRRVAPDQSTLWEHTVIAQLNTYQNKLLRDEADSFYLAYSNGYSVWVSRFNDSGQQLWPSEILINSGALSSSTNWTAQRCLDGNLRVIWIASDGLHIGRINPSGDILPELPIVTLENISNTMILDIHLLPEPNDQAYLSLVADVNNSLKFLSLHLDDTGSVDEQPLLMGTAPHYNTINPAPWYGMVGDDLLCVYQNVQQNLSQLKIVSRSLDGSMENAILSSSGYGYCTEPVLAASQTQVICAWLETSINSSNNRRILFQIFNQGGAPLLPQAGVLPAAGAYTAISYLKAVAISGGEFMLFWRESSTRIRAQLISASGAPLWEPEGRIIQESPVGNYGLSQVEDTIYLASDVGTSIRLQKLVAGQLPWGSQGITIPCAETGSVSLLGFKDDYLVYGLKYANTQYIGYERITVLRFNSEGSVLPGFGNGEISFYPEPAAIKIQLGGCKLTPQGLLLKLDHGHEHGDVYGSYMTFDSWMGHLVDPQGQMPWGTGIPDFRDYILGAEASGFYLRWVTTTGSLIKKYDYSGQQLWSQTCVINNSNNSDSGDFGALQLANGAWIGIGATRANDAIYTIRHYSFGSEGGVNTPPDSRLESRASVSNAKLIQMNNAVFVCWGLSDTYSSTYTQLYLQKLNVIPLSSDDPIAPTPPLRLVNIRPNPFVEGATIDIEGKKSDHVQMAVYNLRGQKLRVLIDGQIGEGLYTTAWDGKDEHGVPVASGIYLIKLQAEGTQSRCYKLLKLK